MYNPVFLKDFVLTELWLSEVTLKDNKYISYKQHEHAATRTLYKARHYAPYGLKHPNSMTVLFLEWKALQIQQ